jgi:ketosteroid isomerase-like protein
MSSSTKYPSRKEIASIFRHLETGDPAETFKRVSPDVDWTVMGTHPCAGRYKSLKEFKEATFQRLGKIMKPPGIKLKVRNVVGGEDQEWAVVELVAVAECNSGKSSRLGTLPAQAARQNLCRNRPSNRVCRTQIRQHVRLGCPFRRKRTDRGS